MLPTSPAKHTGLFLKLKKRKTTTEIITAIIKLVSVKLKAKFIYKSEESMINDVAPSIPFIPSIKLNEFNTPTPRITIPSKKK